MTWGAVQLAMGFVPNWRMLALCRLILGALEVRNNGNSGSYVAQCLTFRIAIGWFFPCNRLHYHYVVYFYIFFTQVHSYRAEGTHDMKSKNAWRASFCSPSLLTDLAPLWRMVSAC
jgi:hypothetical protein